ncbi:MAG: DEAD/DEAH box helicase [Chloroflexota bacterium]|nr:DEAD/DEAH box helicase [Chloroflexota bacterium]
MSKHLSFHGGTLVVEGGTPEGPLAPPWRFLNGKWRCEAFHYNSLIPWIQAQGIRDMVPRWQPLNYTLLDLREPHDYQVKALASWRQAGRRGSVILPTGAGKTFVAVRAIAEVNRSTVIVCPTLDLLHQWYSILRNAFSTEIGVFYGGEKNVLPLTVTTYHSFSDLVAEYGNYFKFLILDESHHATAPFFGEGALMTPAPYRLGLTATYPSEREQGDGRWRLDELVGPVVYALRIDDLIGDRLALYRTQRIRVSLNEDEQRDYQRDYEIYMGYARRRGLIQRYRAAWLHVLMTLSTRDAEARAALLARQRIGRLLAGCEGKLQAVDRLLREHQTSQTLIFTENNEVAYTISRRHFIPIITHRTPAQERKDIIDGFRERRYAAIVTTRVLNEGIDVPEAKVALILGGTSGAREYIQRLGRILRKVENRQAVLYEILVRGTTEEGKVQRRRAAQKKEARSADQ